MAQHCILKFCSEKSFWIFIQNIGNVLHYAVEDWDEEDYF